MNQGGSGDAQNFTTSSVDRTSCSNTLVYNDNNNDNDLDLDDDTGFTVVQKRKRRKNTTGESVSVTSESSSVASVQPLRGLTVIVKPKDPTRQISKINPLKLRDKLESLAPDGVLRVRPNPRLNLLALDTRNWDSTKSLLTLTSIEGIAVQTYEPRSYDMAVGVIRGVATDMSEEELTLALRATVPVKQVRRFGQSEAVKLVFDTNTAPAFVTIGYTRFRVAAYLEKPTQCPKCHRFGHIGCVCSKPTRCVRCGEDHERTACNAENPRCTNCNKKHESTSPNCPTYKLEQEISRYKVNKKLGYLSARTAVLSDKKPIRTTDVMDQERAVRQLDDFPLLANREESCKLKKAVENPVAQTQTRAVPTKVQQLTAACSTSKHSDPPTWRTTPLVPGQAARHQRSRSKFEHIKSPSNSNDATQSRIGALLNTLIGFLKNWLSSASSPFAPVLVMLLDAVLPFVTQW